MNVKKKKKREKAAARDIELFLLPTCSPPYLCVAVRYTQHVCTTFAQPLILGPVDRLLSGERR